MPRTLTWTDEELRVLAENYKLGMSASQIGALLDKSRSAVIGMARRCGMQLPDEAWANGADPVSGVNLGQSNGRPGSLSGLAREFTDRAARSASLAHVHKTNARTLDAAALAAIRAGHVERMHEART